LLSTARLRSCGLRPWPRARQHVTREPGARHWSPWTRPRRNNRARRLLPRCDYRRGGRWALWPFRANPGGRRHWALNGSNWCRGLCYNRQRHLSRLSELRWTYFWGRRRTQGLPRRAVNPWTSLFAGPGLLLLRTSRLLRDLLQKVCKQRT
jgi:hypothetical protein